jgi:hypothetical protein
MTETRKVLYEFPVPSTEMGDVQCSTGGGSLRLSFDYERDDGEEVRGGLAFHRRRAFRHRAESHCTSWHIAAYDKVTEIEDSDWVAELLAATSEDRRGMFEMHHYVVYFDSSGCYEVVAQSWEALPEVLVGKGGT